MNTFTVLEVTWKSHSTMSKIYYSHGKCYLGQFPQDLPRRYLPICKDALKNLPDIFFFYNSCWVKSGTHFYESCQDSRRKKEKQHMLSSCVELCYGIRQGCGSPLGKNERE